MTDNVNHPPHYTHYKGLEIIDLVEQMSFNLGNAVNYIARAETQKNPAKAIQDLEKAVWHIRREEARWRPGDAIYGSTYDGLMNKLVMELCDYSGLAVERICWRYHGSLDQAAYFVGCVINNLKEKDT